MLIPTNQPITNPNVIPFNQGHHHEVINPKGPIIGSTSCSAVIKSLPWTNSITVGGITVVVVEFELMRRVAD